LSGPVAFLFSGQATEEPGMGRALFASDPEARTLLELASERAGVDLARVLQRGGPALDRTEVVQPLIAAIGLAGAALLRRAGVRPAFTAGHSLGELVAWSAAGGLPERDAVEVAAERGGLMAAAARAHPGGLLALTAMTGFTASRRPALERHVAADPDLAIAAFNAPTEVVVSGPMEALERTRREWGGRIVQRIGPWHHPVMGECVAPLRALLSRHLPSALEAVLVANRNGQPLDDPAAGPGALAEQLVHPVRWDAVLRTLHAVGVRTFVLVGLERTLRGLTRLNGFGDVRVLPAVDPRSVDEVARILG